VYGTAKDIASENVIATRHTLMQPEVLHCNDFVKTPLKTDWMPLSPCMQNGTGLPRYLTINKPREMGLILMHEEDIRHRHSPFTRCWCVG